MVRFLNPPSRIVPQFSNPHDPGQLISAQQRSGMQDPFAIANQQQFPMMVPDTPVQADSSMVEFLVGTDDYPEQFKEKFWWTLPRDIPLTFIDAEEKAMKKLMFQINKIDMINTVPYYDYGFTMEAEWDVAEGLYDIRLDRAKGTTNKDMKNERLTQQSQFVESSSRLSDMGANLEVSNNFLKRLLGRR